MSYVKFETPEEVRKMAVELISVAKDTGKVRKGINEATKSIERKAAKLVVIAEDISPPEIAMHIPGLCEEMGIQYLYVKTKKELGEAAGLKVGTSSIAVENAGSGAELLQDIVKRLPKQEGKKKGEK